MFTVLSPAKKMDSGPVPTPVEASTPYLMRDAEKLMGTLRGLTQTRIRELMGVSRDLAKETYDRFRGFELPFTAENAKPAALAFAGDVYRGLDASSLPPESLLWAQDRLGILSGLFGILRPLDLIQPYRLEMKTRLKTRRGKDLYAFWGDRVAERVRSIAATHQDSTLVDLASGEYSKVLRPKHMGLRVVTPVFHEVKEGGEGKVISFLAKHARGSMARFIVDERVEEAEDLKAFDRDRYVFRPDRSTADRWVFSRDFIPAR